MSMSADDLNTMNWVCVGPLVLLIMAFCAFVAWLSSSGSMVSVEPDPCQGAADELATSDGEPRTVAENIVYEIPAVNPWSAVYTGQQIYAPDMPVASVAPEEESPTQLDRTVESLDSTVLYDNAQDDGWKEARLDRLIAHNGWMLMNAR